MANVLFFRSVFKLAHKSQYIVFMDVSYLDKHYRGPSIDGLSEAAKYLEFAPLYIYSNEVARTPSKEIIPSSYGHWSGWVIYHRRFPQICRVRGSQ